MTKGERQFEKEKWLQVASQGNSKRVPRKMGDVKEKAEKVSRYLTRWEQQTILSY